MPRTTVGSDVWIGHGAKIRAGVNIGHGAVIGMGSVVTKDVAPYTVVAGVPAKEIGKRFDAELIEGLLASQWWNYDDEKLKRAAVYFAEPREFLKRVHEL